MAAPSAGLSKEFNLNKAILGVNSAEKISVTLATAADVIAALKDDTAFPERANGQLPLGSIALGIEPGKDVTFNAGPAANPGQTSISFKAAVGLKTGIGVFDTAADAIRSLQLQTPEAFDLSLPADAGTRHLLMLWGYDVSGTVSGSHPIGALGSVTFGAEGSRDAVYAVLHSFPRTMGARTAIEDTVASWRLPRHVTRAEDLEPATWLISEVDGTVALRVGAQLGYDFNFIREFKLAGVPHELSAKIDAGVKATFGFSASGRYILVLGRESAASTVRLRLFKQNKKGLSFALNATVGITGHADLPDQADDLVAAILGVHGQQVVKDLQLIEQWTDPKKDLGETVAGLINKTGLDLLTKTTGIDAAAEFEKARGLVLAAIKKWNALPDTVSSTVWKSLGKLDAANVTEFKTFLTALADPDPQKRAKELTKAISDVAFGDTPQGQFLAAIAPKGLLVLTKQLDVVQKAAADTLGALNGDVIKKLQDFISEKLNLQKVVEAVDENSFNKLDGWLVKRLGAFFNRELHFSDLTDIKNTIHAVVKKRQEIYSKALKALNTNYKVDFASSYAKNTTGTALLDINFDLSDPDSAAANLFRDVVTGSGLDRLLIESVAGVTLNQATLSHEIQRTGTVQLHMPFFSFDSQHTNDSIVKLTAQEDAGRVLVYQLDATDTVTIKNRYKSELSVLGALRVKDGAITIAPNATTSVAYQSLQVKENMTLAELDHRCTPFIQANLPSLFGGGPSSLQTFYTDLDRTVENAVHNGSNEFGDVLLNMQVSMPGAVLANWFRKQTVEQLASDSMRLSRRLQMKLRQLIPSYFFQDVGRLQPNPTAAALLVWSSLPISTSVDFENGVIRRFNTDKDVFWDHVDIDLRRAMAGDPHTLTSLADALKTARARLLDAGDERTADFFTANQTSTFVGMTREGMGDVLLTSLLITEKEIVKGAVAALKDIQSMLGEAASAPTKAISRFADFGADLTATFNDKLKPVYGDDALRTLGSMVLLEASAILDPAAAALTPTSMLSLTVLKETRAFQMADFLKGETPAQEDIAVAQTLVSA